MMVATVLSSEDDVSKLACVLHIRFSSVCLLLKSKIIVINYLIKKNACC